MNTAQKLQKVAEGVQQVYDAGCRKAENECRNKHCCVLVTGDGTENMRFHLDFEPDLIEIVNHDPDIRANRGINAFFQLDLTALGQLAGLYGITSGPTSDTALGSYTNMLMALAGVSKRYQRDADGTVTVGGLVYDSLQGVWGEGVEYTVMAVKCMEKSDKERLTRSIMRLPEGKAYRIYIAQAKKEQAFTDEEWQALIAQRPTYTFIMA